MKPRYAIRIDDAVVTVEHRARLRWQTVALGSAGFFVLCFMQGVPAVFGRPVVEIAETLGVLLLLYVPLMVLLSAFPLYARAEVLHCDAQELRLARRRLFRRWNRTALPTKSVEKLRLVQHIGRDRRHYSSLIFASGGQWFEMLENISDADAKRVMAGCSALGAALYVDPEDTTCAAMNADIAERGWWVNPWSRT